MLAFLLSVALAVLCCLFPIAVAQPLSLQQVSVDFGTIAAEQIDGVFEVTLDIGTLTDGTSCNLSSAVLRTLASQINFTMIRVGGTEGDMTYLDLTNSSTSYPPPPAPAPYRRTLTAGTWDELVAFAQAGGMRGIFGLNAGPGTRTAAGGWDPSMAEGFVRRNAEVHPGFMVGYEYSNEPNLFSGTVHMPSSGQQWAADVQTVRSMLNEVDASLLSFCCDVTFVSLLGEEDGFLRGFALAGGLEHINATTWHLYPLLGGPSSPLARLDPYWATPGRAVDPLYLNMADKWGSQVEAIVRDSGAGTPVWLGETASACFGGGAGVSDRFADAFAAVDKAGLITRLGQRKAFRQELCATHWTNGAGKNGTAANSSLVSPPYTLIDAGRAGYVPRPTYYMILLFRRLVGDRAFATMSSADDTLRVYAYERRNDAGSAVVVVLNANAAARQSPLVCTPQAVPSSFELELYVATGCGRGAASASNLTADTLCVNGAQLSSDLETGRVSSPIVPQSAWGVAWTGPGKSGCFFVSGTAGGGALAMAPHAVWFVALKKPV